VALAGAAAQVELWWDGVAAHRVQVRRGASGVALDAAASAVGARFAPDGEAVLVRRAGEAWRLERRDAHAAPAEGQADAGRLAAPIPGRLVQLLVGVGDAVEQGQLLAVMEADEDGAEVPSALRGAVSGLAHAVGDSVEEGQALVVLEAGVAPLRAMPGGGAACREGDGSSPVLAALSGFASLGFGPAWGARMAASPEAVLRLGQRLLRLDEDGLEPRWYDISPAAMQDPAAVMRAAGLVLADAVQGRAAVPAGRWTCGGTRPRTRSGRGRSSSPRRRSRRWCSTAPCSRRRGWRR
jgi:biotin carboxyl carrier protein